MSDPRLDANELYLLAMLLAQPADDALEALKDLLPQAPWLSEAVAELERLPLERWQGEHTRLFVNGYPKTPCPPFESAYRQGHMGGTAAGDLEALYLRVGLASTGAPADFLGTLLECAAMLAERGDSDSKLCELWDEHLVRWAPRFADDLEAHGRLKLYRSVGIRLGRLFPEQAHDG